MRCSFCIPLEHSEKTVLKQYPLGTPLENGTLFAKWDSFFLNPFGTGGTYMYQQRAKNSDFSDFDDTR